MASLTCTITKAGRSDAYGRPLIVGQTYTSGFDEVKSLVQAGFASVSNPSVVLDDGFFNVAGNAARFQSKTPTATTNDSSGALEGFVGADGAEKKVVSLGSDAMYAASPTTPGQTFRLAIEQSWSSGIPFVMPANGTINNTAGSVTVGTAFDYVIGPSYAFFPANALFASSPAGWYYTNWTAATIGTVYANTYLNGNPQIPSTPTPLVTVAGGYTQTTAFDVVGPNVVIPGNTMGPNGFIEWQRCVNNNNSAGNKIYNNYFGGTSYQGVTQTTNPKEAGIGTLKNRGRATAQIAANASHGDNNNVSSFTKLSIDTSQNQVASMSIQLATATDYAIIESWAIKVFYGA